MAHHALHPRPARRQGRWAALLPLAAVALAGTLVIPVDSTRAAAASYATTVLADAPVAWWRLAETAGTVAADAAGTDPGAYRNGPSLGVAGLLRGDPAARAASFDGVDDHVRAPSTAALSPTGSVSVEAWFRADRLPAPGAFASVVTKRESWSIQFNGPRLEFTIMQGGVRRRLQAPAGSVQAGRAYHVVGTYGNGGQRLYVDGARVASASLAGPITANANDVTIGSWDGTREWLDGTVQDVAVYRDVLSGQRVAAHAGAGSAPASPAPSSTPAPTPAAGASASPSASASPGASPTPAASPTPSPATGGLATGMAAHLMWQTLTETNADLDRMRSAGMDYVRFDVSWRNLEPSRGTYQYLDKLDAVIAAVQARGMTLTMTVIETPGWANGNAGMFAPPSSMADYASFTGMLARRYAARPGMVWEIWNEENDPHFWTTGPNAAQYASMLTAAAAAIRAGDPDATVLTGGILFNNTAFLEGLYAAGAGNSFDGVAIHPYTINRAPGDTTSPYYSYASSVPQFQAVLANHGQGAKPIWVTEFGWSTASVSDATRATWFTQAATIARGWSNVRGLAAYTLHQSQFAEYGLLTTTGAATLSWNAWVAAQ